MKTLKELRELAGLSIAEAARQSGKPLRTWHSWEDDGPNGRPPNPLAIAWLVERLRLQCLPLPDLRRRRPAQIVPPLGKNCNNILVVQCCVCGNFVGTKPALGVPGGVSHGYCLECYEDMILEINSAERR